MALETSCSGNKAAAVGDCTVPGLVLFRCVCVYRATLNLAARQHKSVALTNAGPPVAFKPVLALSCYNYRHVSHLLLFIIHRRL
jgi:hypothetical protein